MKQQQLAGLSHVAMRVATAMQQYLWSTWLHCGIQSASSRMG